MNNVKLLFSFIILFWVSLLVYAQPIPEAKSDGPIMCECSYGNHKPLDKASSCQVACFGGSNSSPIVDFEAQNRANEVARIAESQRQAEVDRV